MLKSVWEPDQTLVINNRGLRSPIITKGQTDSKRLDSGCCIDKEIIMNLLTKSELRVNENCFEPKQITIASLFDEDDQTVSECRDIFRSEFFIKIVGEKVLCLLDTGSDISCILEAFLGE